MKRCDIRFLNIFLPFNFTFLILIVNSLLFNLFNNRSTFRVRWQCGKMGYEMKIENRFGCSCSENWIWLQYLSSWRMLKLIKCDPPKVEFLFVHQFQKFPVFFYFCLHCIVSSCLADAKDVYWSLNQHANPNPCSAKICFSQLLRHWFRYHVAKEKRKRKKAKITFNGIKTLHSNYFLVFQYPNVYTRRSSILFETICFKIYDHTITNQSF